ALRRAVGAHELRKSPLDRLVALAQGVVVGVGDLRRILPVLELVVAGDLAGEPLQLGGGLAFAQLVDGLGLRGRSLHARETASAGRRNPDNLLQVPPPQRRTSDCQSEVCARPIGGRDGALETGTSLGTRGAGLSSGFFCDPGAMALRVLLSQVPWVTCGLRPPDLSSA